MTTFKLPSISNTSSNTETGTEQAASTDPLTDPLDALFTGRATQTALSATKLEAASSGGKADGSLEAGTVDFKSKLESLRSLLAEDDLSLDILKMSLRRLKQHITDEPTIVAELLPEDIGLLSQALFRTEKIRIIEEAKPKEKKTGKGKKASGPMPIFSAEELDF